jgi:signal transduction histidine kinase
MLRMTSDEQPDEEALRASILGTVLLWFSTGGPIIAALMLLQGIQGDTLRWHVVVLAGLTALLPGLFVLRKLYGYAFAARAFVVHLFVVIAFAQFCQGPTPGITFATVAFMLLSGIFLGTHGARLAFAAALLSLGVGGFAATFGWSVEWDPGYWDPRNPLVWVRYGVVLLFLGGGLLSAFNQLTEGLSKRAASLRDTLERERAERAKSERMQDALERSRRLEALAQFAGGLAHDFNNNLMVTMGSVALIRDEPGVSPRVAELAESAATSVEDSAELVQQLLSLGRRKTSPARRVHLTSFVEHCRSTLRRVLPSEIELKISGDTEAHVLVDVGGLQQCLLNLTINARDALAGRGRFELLVEERTVDQPPQGTQARPGRYAVIYCRDTGCGIDPPHLGRLFEPFFTTKTPSKGTGLGLATIHRYVHDASGFITVESKLGVGTTFALYFPVSESLDQSDTTTTEQHA